MAAFSEHSINDTSTILLLNENDLMGLVPEIGLRAKLRQLIKSFLDKNSADISSISSDNDLVSFSLVSLSILTNTLKFSHINTDF